MSNKNDTRRKLLKSIAASSGAVVAGKSLPQSWSKPIVNSILLPAHAELTDDSDSSGEENCCNIAGTYSGEIEDGRGIKITVDASGAISIVAETEKQADKPFTASVRCYGGKFTATAEEKDHDHVQAEDENGCGGDGGGSGDGSGGCGGGPTITGTVICDSDTIEGFWVSGGGKEKPYIASK